MTAPSPGTLSVFELDPSTSNTPGHPLGNHIDAGVYRKQDDPGPYVPLDKNLPSNNLDRLVGLFIHLVNCTSLNINPVLILLGDSTRSRSLPTPINLNTIVDKALKLPGLSDPSLCYRRCVWYSRTCSYDHSHGETNSWSLLGPRTVYYFSIR